MSQHYSSWDLVRQVCVRLEVEWKKPEVLQFAIDYDIPEVVRFYEGRYYEGRYYEDNSYDDPLKLGPESIRRLEQFVGPHGPTLAKAFAVRKGLA